MQDGYEPEWDSPEARANFATRHIVNLAERRQRRDHLIDKFQREETESGIRPNYFALPSNDGEVLLRSVKGNFRRRMIAESLQREGLESIPEAWKSHNLPEKLKAALQAQHPQARGGEDLPNLLPGEVEIARLTLESVHGEVTSLRARLNAERMIHVRLVDEYGTEYDIGRELFSWPLAAYEVLELLRDATPSPMNTSCTVKFSSCFYDDIDTVAQSMNLRPAPDKS